MCILGNYPIPPSEYFISFYSTATVHYDSYLLYGKKRMKKVSLCVLQNIFFPRKKAKSAAELWEIRLHVHKSYSRTGVYLLALAGK